MSTGNLLIKTFIFVLSSWFKMSYNNCKSIVRVKTKENSKPQGDIVAFYEDLHGGPLVIS